MKTNTKDVGSEMYLTLHLRLFKKQISSKAASFTSLFFLA